MRKLKRISVQGIFPLTLVPQHLAGVWVLRASSVERVVSSLVTCLALHPSFTHSVYPAFIVALFSALLLL